MKSWFAYRPDGRADRRAGHSVRRVDGAARSRRARSRPLRAESPPSPLLQRPANRRAKAPANQPPPPPQVAISVQSNMVNVDAVVTDQDGNIVTGLKKENFRILDEGQRQQISNFAPTDATITIVMLMEFSKRYGGYFAYEAKYLVPGIPAPAQAAGLGGIEDLRFENDPGGGFHAGQEGSRAGHPVALFPEL